MKLDDGSGGIGGCGSSDGGIDGSGGVGGVAVGGGGVPDGVEGCAHEDNRMRCGKGLGPEKIEGDMNPGPWAMMGASG